MSPSTSRYVKPNTLVRFCGMIQDMFGNECYIGAYKDGSAWRTNKFMDVSQFPMASSPDNRNWERRLLYCVPVPGLNPWAEISTGAAGNESMDWTSEPREKQRRPDDDSSDRPVSGDDDQGSPNTKKMEYYSFAHCAGGGCASIATSFIFTPSERIKQQMQVRSHYGNCWDVLVGIIR